MRDFFHCDTAIYKKRLKTVLAALLAPLIAVCVFCAANIIFNLRPDGDKGFAQLMVWIAVGCVAAGMVFCFAGAYIADRKRRLHARYTYFDILPRGMIYSRYAGQFHIYGERTIYRRLYYIPFSSVTEVMRDGKRSPMELAISGEVREYFLPSEHLGYHIDEDGELQFDNPELMERHFEPRGKLVISHDFGSTKQLERSVQYYLDQFRNAPQKKQFNIADHIAVKSKKALRTSNPMLSAPSFDRKW